jgi:hypothetical protein
VDCGTQVRKGKRMQVDNIQRLWNAVQLRFVPHHTNLITVGVAINGGTIHKIWGGFRNLTAMPVMCIYTILVCASILCKRAFRGTSFEGIYLKLIFVYRLHKNNNKCTKQNTDFSADPTKLSVLCLSMSKR